MSILKLKDRGREITYNFISGKVELVGKQNGTKRT